MMAINDEYCVQFPDGTFCEDAGDGCGDEPFTRTTDINNAVCWPSRYEAEASAPAGGEVKKVKVAYEVKLDIKSPTIEGIATLVKRSVSL